MALLCCIAETSTARMWHQRCCCFVDNFLFELGCLAEALGGLEVVGVAAGLAHTVACTDSGDVYSWGWNADGQLGLGDDGGRAEPELVSAALLEHEHIEQVTSCGFSLTVQDDCKGDQQKNKIVGSSALACSSKTGLICGHADRLGGTRGSRAVGCCVAQTQNVFGPSVAM